MRGEAYFYNLRIGDYLFKALRSDNSEWGALNTTLDGLKTSFDIIEKPRTPSASVLETVPKPSVTSCSCVAFRLDNVQDYWLDSVQIKVMETFEQEHAPLTIGVISNSFGNDSDLTNYLKPKVRGAEIEVGINGWDFEDFTALSRTQQYQLLEQSALLHN